MLSESECSIEESATSRAKAVGRDVLAAVREGTRAMEAEATAMMELEQAYKRANDAAAEFRSAIKAEAAAKVEVGQARNGTKQPLPDLAKAGKVAVKTDGEQERRVGRLKAGETKVAKASLRDRSQCKENSGPGDQVPERLYA